jgi:hypothetical protein
MLTACKVNLRIAATCHYEPVGIFFQFEIR